MGPVNRFPSSGNRGTLGTSFSAMFPWLIGLKSSGDGVQNLSSGDEVQNIVPRVSYGAPTLMVIFNRRLANFEGPGSLWLGAQR